MKRAAAACPAAAELAAVLDRAKVRRSPGEERAEAEREDGEIAARAAVEEERRRAFDAVLERSEAEWARVEDPAVLRDALCSVLEQIRGPVLERVGRGVEGELREDDAEMELDDIADALDGQSARKPDPEHSFAERARYIPLRLSSDERKVLRLVEAALNVSEYTDVVDVLTYSKMKTRQRIHAQIRDLCSILTGLAVASDYARGQELLSDRDFAANEAFFQTAFEVARRHKVACPEKNRNTYGKLVHMLQDSVTGEISRLLEFSCVKPLNTVALYLQQRGGLELLDDPLMEVATKEIIADGKARSAVQAEIRQKERAVEVLAKRYRNGRTLGLDEIRRCLYSIGDNNAYLRCARDPCDTMIDYLHKYFGPERPPVRGSSLAIVPGRGGARLTHDHSRQFSYVFQSLGLWREISDSMYKLWYLSEQDLLNPKNPYHLRNTGQGLNRVQAAPSVSKAMYQILNKVQKRVGSWVGSSVVHLGDSNVPNALVFIDKYAQVQRILGPITTCIRRIGDLAKEDERIGAYIETTFGGVEQARRIILRDFFRHAFDGSGASDWFSAGSCIDGRLTSAWNWCSEVEKKPYFPLFLLTGFSGFDGDF